MKKLKDVCPEVTIKYKKGNVEKCKISTSKDVYNFAKKVFDADTMDYQEEFIIIHMNKANVTLGWQKISSGGISATVVDPRIIFSSALAMGSSSLILCHNHPSGNIKPSRSDLNITKKLQECALLLDMHILDHLIITSEYGYYSFADEGMLI